MLIRHRDVGSRRPIRHRFILRVEQLETRVAPATLTPAQVSRAYGFEALRFYANGNTYRADGSGQTIAIVAAYRNPNVFADLDVFDRTYKATHRSELSLYNQYGPASGFLTVANPQGTPSISTPWSEEIALDVQWAHAIAPGAKIVLVQAKSSTINDLTAAVDYARHYPGVSVVSMSWGSAEFSTQVNYDNRFTTPAGHGGVTFIGASGDYGAPGIWPAVSKNVLAVGGTTLQTDYAGNALSETTWTGSGGGMSRFVSLPNYQTSVFAGSMRGSPDVSYNADPSTGFSVYSSVGGGGWRTVGGTSAGAPQWAALVAIANQGRALAGLPALTGEQTLSAIYSMPASNFRDITIGSNGLAATAGYDLATGRGSPYAFPVVRDLVYYTITSPPVGTISPPLRTVGTALGKNATLGFRAAVSAGEAVFGSVGSLPFFPTTITSAPAPGASFVSQVTRTGQTLSTETSPAPAHPRPKADAAWWGKADTEADYNLDSADDATASDVEDEGSETRDEDARE